MLLLAFVTRTNNKRSRTRPRHCIKLLIDDLSHRNEVGMLKSYLKPGMLSTPISTIVSSDISRSFLRSM